jgi:hypothetical protein
MIPRAFVWTPSPRCTPTVSMLFLDHLLSSGAMNLTKHKSNRRSGSMNALPGKSRTRHYSSCSRSQAPVGQCLGLSMVTASTGYQRLLPRSRTSSCLRLLLAAITCATPQLTCVHPWKACSHSAALISSMSCDCTLAPPRTRGQHAAGRVRTRAGRAPAGERRCRGPG